MISLTDLENQTRKLESALAAERERADRLGGWLTHVINFELERSERDEIDAALSEWRTARGKQ